MKRSPMARGTTRIRRESPKVRRGRKDFAAVYAEVDARSGGRCEVAITTMRCGVPAEEHHHLFKPRKGTCERCGIDHLRGHHRKENILHVCAGPEGHHDEFEREYAKGRREETTFNEALGRYDTEIRFAPSKFALRGQA